MSRQRLKAEDKINIINQHIKKAKISETCAEFNIHPNQFSGWMKTILETGVNSLNGRNKNAESNYRKEIDALHKELYKKDTIIARLAEENIELKKVNGGN